MQQRTFSVVPSTRKGQGIFMNKAKEIAGLEPGICVDVTIEEMKPIHNCLKSLKQRGKIIGKVIKSRSTETGMTFYVCSV